MKDIIRAALVAGIVLVQSWSVLAADRPAKTVIVAVDLSQSTIGYRGDYLQYFRVILDTMGEGDQLLVVRIGERPSASSSTAMDAVIYNTSSITDNPKKIAAKNLNASLLAIRNFEAMLTSEIQETPILDTVAGSPRLFNLHKSPRQIIVLMSDMMESTKTTANFESKTPPFGQKQAEDFLRRLKKDGRITDLRGISVYVAGARELKEDKNSAIAVARRNAVKWFWTGYFSEAGASLAPEAYATDFLGFDSLECNKGPTQCKEGIFVRQRDKLLKKP